MPNEETNNEPQTVEALIEFDIKAAEDPEAELVLAPQVAEAQPFIEPEGTGRKFAFKQHPDDMNPGLRELYFRIRYQAQIQGRADMVPDKREIWESTIVSYLGAINSRKLGLTVSDEQYSEAVELEKKRLSSLGVVVNEASRLGHRGPIVS